VRKVVTGAIASAALLGAAFIAPAAQAAPCDGVGSQQPFLDWNDQASYVLVDGGDFESAAAGWTLEGGATTMPGGNPYRTESTTNSLALPAGSSATSPPVCVSKGNPSARLFADTLVPSTGKKVTLQVDVLYLNGDGSVRKVKKAGKLKQEPMWDATRKFSLAQGQFQHGKVPGHGHGGPKPDHPGAQKTAQIELRFTPLADTTWLIDDVFVDPRMRL
jgi:hypothetical protein